MGPLISGKPRLVKYYNLARILCVFGTWLDIPTAHQLRIWRDWMPRESFFHRAIRCWCHHEGLGCPTRPSSMVGCIRAPQQVRFGVFGWSSEGLNFYILRWRSEVPVSRVVCSKTSWNLRSWFYVFVMKRGPIGNHAYYLFRGYVWIKPCVLRQKVVNIQLIYRHW